jgi:hypothetical protein
VTLVGFDPQGMAFRHEGELRYFARDDAMI